MACVVIDHMGDKGMIRSFPAPLELDSTGSIHTLDMTLKGVALLWAYEQQKSRIRLGVSLSLSVVCMP